MMLLEPWASDWTAAVSAATVAWTWLASAWEVASSLL
jgi:hypothetical protein